MWTGQDPVEICDDCSIIQLLGGIKSYNKRLRQSCLVCRNKRNCAYCPLSKAERGRLLMETESHSIWEGTPTANFDLPYTVIVPNREGQILRKEKLFSAGSCWFTDEPKTPGLRCRCVLQRFKGRDIDLPRVVCDRKFTP